MLDLLGQNHFDPLTIAKEQANNAIIRETDTVNEAVIEVTTGVSDAFVMSYSNAAPFSK